MTQANDQPKPASAAPVEQELGLAEQLRKLWPEGVTQCKWCGGFSRPPCGCPADEEIERLQETLTRQDAAHHVEVQEQVAAERERCAVYCDREGLYQTARAIRAGEHVGPNSEVTG